MSDILRNSKKKLKIKKKFHLKAEAVPLIFPFSEVKQKRPPNILEETRVRKEILNDATMVEDHCPAVNQPGQEAGSSNCTTAWADEIDESNVDRNSPARSDDGTNDISFLETINDNRHEFFEDDMKFVMSWKQIKDLFHYCLNCGSLAEVFQVYMKGIVLFVKLECTEEHQITWSSNLTDRWNDINVLTAASVLMSGLNISRFLEVMEVAKIVCFTDRTYSRIQKNVLIPSINAVYHCAEWLNSAKDEPCLELLGDGRCDSPGYCATYGHYTLMNEKNDQILDFLSLMSAMLGTPKTWNSPV